MKLIPNSRINTRTIHCSDILYCATMPQESLTGTQWTEGMITSSETLMLRRENEDNSSMMTIYNLRNQDVLSFVTDSLGEVTELIMNDEEYISVVNRDNGQISFLHCLNDSIDYIEGSEGNTRLLSANHSCTTRAGVDGIYFFQTINKALSMFSLFKNASKVVSSSLKGAMSETQTVAGQMIWDAASTGNDEADLVKGLIGSDALQIAFEIASYAEKKFNKYQESYYNLLCGATISVIKPTVEGNRIRFGYSVKNTSKIPHGKGNFDIIERKCYVAVKKEWNGTRKPGIMAVAAGEQYGFTDVAANKDFDSIPFYIPFEKGYTYYFIAKIILSTYHTETTVAPHVGFVTSTSFREVTYSSDIESISSDNIGEIEVNDIRYEDNQIVFDFNIWGGDFVNNDNSRNWNIDLYKDGNKVSWESIFPLGLSGFRCVLRLNRDAFDCNYEDFRATAKGKWQLGSSIYVDGTTLKTYSQLVDFDKLIYNTAPSLIFINPIIQGTETIQTRSSDDDSEKYITFFSYGVRVKGGFWIQQYTAKSDTEGPIATLSSTQPPYSDGEWAYDYSWTYSKEKPISPTLWYDMVLTNGEIKQSVNSLKFTGCPMNNIVAEDLIVETSSN